MRQKEQIKTADTAIRICVKEHIFMPQNTSLSVRVARNIQINMMRFVSIVADRKKVKVVAQGLFAIQPVRTAVLK